MHTWGDYAWDAAAGAAGAGLGFIFGDIPGAIAGAETASGFAHMTHPDREKHRIGLNPVGVKRGRISVNVPESNKRGRVHTNLPSQTVNMPIRRPKRRAVPRKAGPSKRTKPTGNKRNTRRKRTSTAKSGGRHLSGTERREVKKIAVNVTTIDSAKGTLIHANAFGGILVQDQQLVITNDTIGSDMNHFTPRKFHSVASSMFNAMPHVTGYVVNGLNEFPEDTKIRIIDSHVDYHFKNDSTLLYHVDIYEWLPNRNAQNVGVNTPLQVWNNALKTYNYSVNTTLIPATGALQNQMWLNPNHVSQATKEWFNVKLVKTLAMQPGTYAEFKLQGPKNKVIQMKNFVATPVQLPAANGAVYNDYQRGMTKQVMFVIRTEPLFGVAATVPAIFFPGNSSGNGFVGYYKEHFRLAAPRNTHTGAVSVAGVATPATNYTDYLGVFDFLGTAPGTVVTAPVIVQPNNPIQDGIVN